MTGIAPDPGRATISSGVTASERAAAGSRAGGPDELLSHDEARALIRSASNRAPTGIRNRALIATMYRIGLRPGEALGLQVADVDLVDGVMRVPARKGGVGRVTGIDGQTADLIERWCGRRERLGLNANGQLFCTLAGDELKAAYVRELLPRLARRAGIDKRVHPLGLRYACAAEMSAEGLSSALIEAHLGVAASGSARRYLVQFTVDEVVDAVRTRTWRL